MKYHDNSVSFSLSETEYSLISGSFTVESFAVTSGQDPDKNIHAGLTKSFGGNGSMTFRIGRKGSEDIAKWFNNRIPESQTTFNHGAGKLNFAFLGTLKLKLTGGILVGNQDTYTFSNVGIAQGHTGSSNNWWFGGKSCTNISTNRVSCKGINSKGAEVTFMFQRGGNNVSTIDVIPYTFAETVETTAWMSKISDALRLDQIVMPGSHDAGMSETHHCDVAAKIGKEYVVTQGKSVGAQLLDGSRYFDIRVDYDHDELVTYHRTSSVGIGCNGQSLKNVLDETVAFLNAHKTETAIIKISHIRSDRGERENIKSKINALLTASYRSTMYSSTNADINLARVALGEVRGKMIVVLDYPEHIDPSNGRFRYKDGFHGDICTAQTNTNLTVCDSYSNTASYDEMKNDQLSKWEKSAGLDSGHLFLLSWTLTVNKPVVEPSIKTLAEEANSKLPGVLYEQIVKLGKAKPNVVYIDFVDSPTAQSIIQYNF